MIAESPNASYIFGDAMSNAARLVAVRLFSVSAMIRSDSFGFLLAAVKRALPLHSVFI